MPLTGHRQNRTQSLHLEVRNPPVRYPAAACGMMFRFSSLETPSEYADPRNFVIAAHLRLCGSVSVARRLRCHLSAHMLSDLRNSQGPPERLPRLRSGAVSLPEHHRESGMHLLFLRQRAARPYY